MSLGGLFFGDPMQKDTYDLVLTRALELGVNLIDTAPGYKESEAMLGQMLAGRRDRVTLATKYFPYNYPEVNPSPSDLVASVERSLTKLNTDCIDLFQLHWINRVDDLEAIMASDLPAAIERLRDQGKIRFIGLSNASEMDGVQSVLIAAAKTGFFDTIMCCYNIFLQTAEQELFAHARAKDLGVLVMMPLDQPGDGYGLVSTASVRRSVDAMIANKLLPAEAPYTDPEPLGFLIRGGVKSLPEAALRFVLANDAVTTALVGTINPPHLAANLALEERIADAYLPGEDLIRLRKMFGGVQRHKVRM
jgi:L-galactose dehydrogenase